MKTVILTIALTALTASATLNYCFVSGRLQLAGATREADSFAPLFAQNGKGARHAQ